MHPSTSPCSDAVFFPRQQEAAFTADSTNVWQAIYKVDEAVLTLGTVETLVQIVPDERTLERAALVGNRAAGEGQRLTKVDGLVVKLSQISLRLPYLLNCLRFKSAFNKKVPELHQATANFDGERQTDPRTPQRTAVGCTVYQFAVVQTPVLRSSGAPSYPGFSRWELAVNSLSLLQFATEAWVSVSANIPPNAASISTSSAPRRPCLGRPAAWPVGEMTSSTCLVAYAWCTRVMCHSIERVSFLQVAAAAAVAATASRCIT